MGNTQGGRSLFPWPRDLKGKLMTACVVVTFAMMQWPLVTMANKIEPFVCGLPFLFFWVLLWTVVLYAEIIVCSAFFWR